MSKKLTCGDVMPGCDKVIEGDDERRAGKGRRPRQSRSQRDHYQPGYGGKDAWAIRDG